MCRSSFFRSERIAMDTKICADCEQEFDRKKSNRCNSCIYKRNGSKPCNSCGANISKKNKSGLCKTQCKRAGQIANAPVEFGIYGNFPTPDETAIYVLKLFGYIFYVGATKRLIPRMTGHKQKFGKDITLHVLRNVPDSQSVVEECREIVTQADAGITLTNLRTPEPGK